MKTSIFKGIGFAAGFLGLIAAGGCGGSTSHPGGTSQTIQSFTQFDRLARPAINEVFATVANNRHQANNQDNPTDDKAQLANDIQSFMTGTAGRSQAITDAVKAVIIGQTGDVEKADLSSNASKAAYLGVETSGATGSTFGGRALTDDVIDADLGIIFGDTIPKLGLAADDGKEIPTLTTDNVGPQAKHFTNTFPYLGAPQ